MAVEAKGHIANDKNTKTEAKASLLLAIARVAASMDTREQQTAGNLYTLLEMSGATFHWHRVEGHRSIHEAPWRVQSRAVLIPLEYPSGVL